MSVSYIKNDSNCFQNAVSKNEVPNATLFHLMRSEESTIKKAAKELNGLVTTLDQLQKQLKEAEKKDCAKRITSVAVGSSVVSVSLAALVAEIVLIAIFAESFFALPIGILFLIMFLTDVDSSVMILTMCAMCPFETGTNECKSSEIKNLESQVESVSVRLRSQIEQLTTLAFKPTTTLPWADLQELAKSSEVALQC